MSRPLRQSLIALGALIVAASAGVAAYRYVVRPALDQPAATEAGVVVGGSFDLVDHRGRAVTDTDFRGRHMFVSFGYTFCPDVCPTTLATMSAALDELGPAAEQVQPVFVTIDPARDTPEVLADYVANFHPDFIGLTGTAEQIAHVAKGYHVYYAKVTPEGSSSGEGDYLMDHSSLTYLMGPDGAFEAFMTHSDDAAAMAAKIRAHLGDR